MTREKWQKRRIGDLYEVQLGKMLNQAASNGPEKREYLTNTNVRWGSFDLTQLNRMHFGAKEREKFSLKNGDLLVCEGGEVGRCAIWRGELSECYFQKALHRLRPKSDSILPDFTFQFFQYGSRSGLFSHFSSKSSIAHLTREKLLTVPILVPPLSEQFRIAEILQTWDKAIAKLEALRATKERRLEALREKLTFAGVDGEPTRLADMTEELTNRNGEGALGRELVMGVTNSRGIIPMREQTIADDISRYKLVPNRAFAYNPMRVNVGSIAMNEAEETILVSPDYVVFACVGGKLSADFLDHLRKTKWWAHYINSGGSGSVRQRTYYADLAAMKVPLPGYDEQVHIADILNTAQQDVDATAREIDALQRQKRGIMQKLLTGEWRVKLDVVEEGAR